MTRKIATNTVAATITRKIATIRTAGRQVQQKNDTRTFGNLFFSIRRTYVRIDATIYETLYCISGVVTDATRYKTSKIGTATRNSNDIRSTHKKF